MSNCVCALRRLVESVKRLTRPGQATALPVQLRIAPDRYHLAPAEILKDVRMHSIGTVSSGGTKCQIKTQKCIYREVYQ